MPKKIAKEYYMMEFESKNGSNVAIELMDELVSRNMIECKEVELRTINGNLFVDLITNDVSEDTTFTRFLKGDQATLNKRRYSLTRINPADIIEFDVRTLNIENKTVSLVFMKLNTAVRKELNVALSSQNEVNKLISYVC